MGRYCALGLPSFASSFFYNPSILILNPCQNQAAQFQVANAASGSNVSWDFGDSTTGAGATTTHTYSTAGSFNVSVTVTDANGTVSNGQLVTVFAEPILLVTTATLKQCDDNTDGFSAFNLNQAKSALVASQTGLTFSFHKTMGNAIANALPISNTTQYTNQVVSNDVVYIRVQNQNGCFKTAILNLVISTTQITATFTRTLTECDNIASGSNVDGISSFDFTPIKQDVLNLFPSNQLLDVSFYKNLSDALSETNGISNITSYSNISSPNTQNIWVRVDSQTNNDCLGLGQYLKLFVDKIPIVQPLTFRNCDDNQDGFVGFDTSNLESTLRNGLANVAISYIDQSNNPVTMTNPFVTNSRVLNVKVKNSFGRQCEFNSTITFVVSELPKVFPISASRTTACDDEANPANQDGKFAFDTSGFQNLLLGSQTNRIVTFFDQNNNPVVLSNPFLSGTQNIKVEVINTQNVNCKVFGSISFVVNPVPNIDLAGNELVCSNNPNFTKTIDAGLIDNSTINDFSY